MGKYILKRLLWMIPVILGISFILFSILEITPGDPAVMILGESAPPDRVEALREEMGLNEPFLQRYVTYVADALHGDFGSSYRTKLPVFDEILSRFPTTLKLTVGGILLVVILGIPLGILSAVKQYSVFDNVSMVAALILNSMPGFWLGIMLVLLFSVKLNLLPVVTIVGLNFSSLLGGTLIIETVFNIPGLGALMITAVRSKDIPLVMAGVLFVALLGGFINLFVDVLYVYIDPRLKSQFVRGKGK